MNDFRADYEALREFAKEEAEEVIKEAEDFFNEVNSKIFN